MMDKINDNMNANGQQKLSMEDLEEVNGGVDFTFDGTYVYYAGFKETPAQFENHIFDMTKTFGAGVAIKYLNSLTGYWCDEMRVMQSAAGDPDGIYNMGVIMDRFWRNWDGASKH